MLLTRSIIFVVLHITTAVIFSILAIILWPLPFRRRYKIVSQWAIFNLWLLEKVCGISYDVSGAENISDEPCIILCKHQSSWETLALQAIFPPQVWVVKRELLWIPFFGWGLASLNPIAINRGSGRRALKKITKQGEQRLSTGAWVVIFPEGTRVISGTLGSFGISGARLAVATGVPIIPVAHDAGKVWPRHGFVKYPGVIKLVIGAKIASRDKEASALNKSVFDWMEREMRLLEGNMPYL